MLTTATASGCIVVILLTNTQGTNYFNLGPRLRCHRPRSWSSRYLANPGLQFSPPVEPWFHLTSCTPTGRHWTPTPVTSWPSVVDGCFLVPVTG